MAFDISELKSVLAKHGIAKTSNYAAMFSPPIALQSSIINDLPMLCDSVNIPGVSLQTDQVRHKGYGLFEQRPTQATFEDITVTLIADAKGLVLDFLHKWMALVTNYDGESEKSTYGIASETFNYPEEYWGTIEIYLYDSNANKYVTYVVHKAFPIAVGAVQMGWENSDTLMRIPASFSYRSFTSNTTDGLNISNTSSERLQSILTNPTSYTLSA